MAIVVYYPAVLRRLPTAVLLLALWPVTVVPAWAWGCRGHEIVALIAAAHLQPEVAARVRQILAVPVGGAGTHPCRGSARLPPMARIASWADAVRTPVTEPFHFVDLPVGARRGHLNYSAVCHADCISAALTRFRQQLQAPSTSPRQRAIALRYVIHLVGDAFQPLHVSDNGDRGGNCVRTRLPSSRRRSNLHADWDTYILEGLMGTEGPIAYARKLDTRFGTTYAQGSLQPLAWVWASHAVAARVAYGPLHLSPGCHARVLRLSRPYVRRAGAAIDRQLDRAGWRLAEVLNQACARGWGEPR